MAISENYPSWKLSRIHRHNCPFSPSTQAEEAARVETERQAAVTKRADDDRQRKQREEEEERKRDSEIRNRAKSVAELRKTENVVAKKQAPSKTEEQKLWVRHHALIRASGCEETLQQRMVQISNIYDG